MWEIDQVQVELLLLYCNTTEGSLSMNVIIVVVTCDMSIGTKP